MAEPKLKTVTRTQGNNQALKDGTVKPRTFEFDFVEVDPLIDALPPHGARHWSSTSARWRSRPTSAPARTASRMTAVPVFLVRAFHHGAILVNTKAGIRSPKDLEGKRVGVNRGYTVTTGVWARGILQDEHGVDLARSPGCCRATSTSPSTGRRRMWCRSRRARRWPTCWPRASWSRRSASRSIIPT